jgi:hypothetical protein
LTFALDPVPHPALFAAAFFAGAFFAAFFTAIPLSSFLVYACDRLLSDVSASHIKLHHGSYRNHDFSSNQEFF